MTQPALPGLGAVSDYHDFRERLEFAEVNSNLSRLEVFYKSCFPNVGHVRKAQRQLQRQGIDTIVELQNGKKVYFDEKIRGKDYGDVLLEEYGVWKGYPRIMPPGVYGLAPIEIGIFEPVPDAYERFLKHGWINGQKKTDYIAYVVKPSKKVYFLPFLLLQRAWARYHHDWLGRFGRKAAPNRLYHTTNIPIPVDTLFEALYETASW